MVDCALHLKEEASDQQGAPEHTLARDYRRDFEGVVEVEEAVVRHFDDLRTAWGAFDSKLGAERGVEQVYSDVVLDTLAAPCADSIALVLGGDESCLADRRGLEAVVGVEDAGFQPNRDSNRAQEPEALQVLDLLSPAQAQERALPTVGLVELQHQQLDTVVDVRLAVLVRYADWAFL